MDELDDSFIDANDVKQSVLDKLIAKVKYRQDGEMFFFDKKRIAIIEALSLDEINFICSSTTYFLATKKPDS
jgi:hypothetical protein